jgi:hypothetical protein
MKHYKIFENFRKNNILIIDVQKSFNEFYEKLPIRIK